MKQRFVVTIAALMLAAGLAGCGDNGSKDFTGDGAAPQTTETVARSEPAEVTVPADAPEVDGPDFEDVAPETPDVEVDLTDDEVYLLALEDIQGFWVEEYPGLYFDDFTELPEDRILPIGPGDDSGAETCFDDLVTHEIVVDNAVAFDCPEGQMVAWDEEGLLLYTSEQFGPFASSAILAHEFGHVVQYQSGGQLPTPFSELQADCFAGAWVADVSDNPPAGLEDFADPAVVDATLSAMLTLRDPVGFEATEEGAHGNGFDRVRTFQDGFERGPEECAGYDQTPPSVTEVAFTTEEEELAGGNMAFVDLLPAATEDLDLYFAFNVEGWEPLGTLAPEDLDTDTLSLLTNLNDSIGDGAPLVFLGLGWAQSLQQLVGADQGRDETGQLLQAVCIAGDWMAHLFHDVEGDPTFNGFSLSPGDLDEAILGLIEVSSGSGASEPGAVFELLSAYRQGVLERLGSCGL